ncbi:MAG: type II toxin-antitoxin system RelE/ParE family toxin [Coriobacteriia bacterium]|nr:type II toxin-antitoxin system RelE/ParE family toxin [Coriobacteriia bacterium]MBS5478420.1 type II toxin-antitoxin system RelE/ParE family toxin [Coriobacteriia bacterium]
MYQVEFYETSGGAVPVEDFLDGLPIKLREKTLRGLLLLQEMGPALRGEESSYLREGLFELRVQFGGDITRCFYFFHVGKRIIVTSGFVKKAQKTPAREIERALRYKRDWEGRYGTTNAR